MLWWGLAIGVVLLTLGITLFFAWQGKEEGKTPESRPFAKGTRPGKVEPPQPPPDEGLDKLPVWAPDPALLEQLGPYVQFREHRMRLPKGYKVVDERQQAGILFYSIQGPQTSEKFFALLDVEISKRKEPLPGGFLLESLRGHVDRVAEGIVSELRKSRRTATELGRVNGFPSARTTWEGTFVSEELNYTIKRCGFFYSLDDGVTGIAISSSDETPRGQRSLSLSEAAALTFEKLP
jgi:hypothetical protein